MRKQGTVQPEPFYIFGNIKINLIVLTAGDKAKSLATTILQHNITIHDRVLIHRIKNINNNFIKNTNWATTATASISDCIGVLPDGRLGSIELGTTLILNRTANACAHGVHTFERFLMDNPNSPFPPTTTPSNDIAHPTQTTPPTDTMDDLYDPINDKGHKHVVLWGRGSVAYVGVYDTYDSWDNSHCPKFLCTGVS